MKLMMANLKVFFSGIIFKLSGMRQKCEYSIEFIDSAKLAGCGILLNSKNQLAIFFTLNGILLGELSMTHDLIINDLINKLSGTPIPTNPTVDRLYPTVYISYPHISV
jgi:hypothetical protein